MLEDKEEEGLNRRLVGGEQKGGTLCLTTLKGYPNLKP